MKLIIADLDGTLMHKKVMSEETKKTIKKLQSSDIPFTLATGRHKDALRPVVESLHIEIPVICTNGAFIYDFKAEKVIHQDTINASTLESLLNVLEGYDYLVYTTKAIVSSQASKAKLEQRIGVFQSVVINEDTSLLNHLKDGVLKLLVIEDDQSKLEALREKLINRNEIYVLQSQKAFLDIGSGLASKGRAVRILSEYLDIDTQSVLAIGDQENDVSMIEVAGLGVAMGNAETVLKEKADFITKTFEEEGFTYAIETHVFK